MPPQNKDFSKCDSRLVRKTTSKASWEPEARLSGKTVFILGSGFSRALGVPIMADFVTEGLALLKYSAWNHQGSRRGGRKNDAKLLNQMLELLRNYQNTLEQIDSSPANLEDLFCLVDLLSVANSRERRDRRILGDFIGRVCALAWKRHEREWSKRRKSHEVSGLLWPNTPTVTFRHYFSDKGVKESQIPFPEEIKVSSGRPRCDNAGNVCLYEAFLSQVLFLDPPPVSSLRCPPEYATNAILSLNYDLIIEQVAARAAFQVFYGQGVLSDDTQLVGRAKDVIVKRFSDSRGICIPLLKLHGSLNWKERVLGSDHVDECSLQEGGARVPLIFPTWQRNPIGTGRSARLLTAARTHLRSASRLVLIGYSMPETDRYLRYLFADVFSTPERPEIEVCNLNWTREKAIEQSHAFLGKRGTFRLTEVHRSLSDYVQAHKTPYSL